MEATPAQQEKGRMRRRIVMAWPIVLLVPVLACGENVLPKKGSTRADVPDAPWRDPEANCVTPGTPPNERGVGSYCEKGTGQCEAESGQTRFCTADFSDIAPVLDNQWFCSTVCTMDEECGSGAVCSTTMVASGCVPLSCLPDASF
jgi:hypothetical protein